MTHWCTFTLGAAELSTLGRPIAAYCPSPRVANRRPLDRDADGKSALQRSAAPACDTRKGCQTRQHHGPLAGFRDTLHVDLVHAEGFVDAMGGVLTLDDTPGGGLTVTIALMTDAGASTA